MHPTRGAQVRQQNRDKSDLLAHPAHLARWFERNRDDRSELEELFNFNNLSHDVDRSRCVTSWAFGQGSSLEFTPIYEKETTPYWMEVGSQR